MFLLLIVSYFEELAGGFQLLICVLALDTLRVNYFSNGQVWSACPLV